MEGIKCEGCWHPLPYSYSFLQLLPFLSVKSALMPDGGIVISARNQAVVFDKYGNIRWSWKSSEPIYLLATDLMGDLYLAFGNTVAGLSKDGILKWQTDVYDIVHALTVMDGILLVGWDHGLFALNLNGSLAWEYFKPPNC
jgi:hypothetical protein